MKRFTMALGVLALGLCLGGCGASEPAPGASAPVGPKSGAAPAPTGAEGSAKDRMNAATKQKVIGASLLTKTHVFLPGLEGGDG